MNSQSSVLDPRSSAAARPSKPVIGLVGGMGSGKSRVAEELAKRGARLISGDPLGHDALRQPDIRDQAVRRWGPDVLDGHGAIDRRRLGAIVFADAAERRERAQRQAEPQNIWA
jgi:dephospho-CoA kinase